MRDPLICLSRAWEKLVGVAIALGEEDGPITEATHWIAQAALDMPATSPAGAAFKLRVVTRAIDPGDPDFRDRMLLSAEADLERLARAP